MNNLKPNGNYYMVFKERLNNRLFSYYVSDNEPLDMIFTVPASQKTELQIYEASYDLLKRFICGTV